MKRILLSLTAIAAVFAANSQTLYNQIGSDGSGIISNQYTDASADTMIVCADDFTIPVGGTWNVTGVSVSGFRNDPSATGVAMTSIEVMILQDASGMPGSTIVSETFSVNIPAPSSDTTLNLDFATPANMTEGTYWISVKGFAPANSRWNWSTLSGTYGASAMLIDPDDWFGAGATTWTNFASLGLSASALSFSINGTGTMVGVEENEVVEISVYPNPAINNITIATPNNDVIENVVIYDAMGKIVYSEVTPSNTIDIADLASGTYLVEVTTANGTAQERIIKK